MKYWKRLLEEVLNKDNPDYAFRLTNINAVKKNACVENNDVSRANKTDTVDRKKSKKKKCSVGRGLEKVDLTGQEVACLKQVLKGKTYPEIAVSLGISHRTVEYYIKNVRAKLGCRTRSELIQKAFDMKLHQQRDD